MRRRQRPGRRARIRGRERSQALDRVMLAIGIGFVAAGVLSGLTLLRTRDAPLPTVRGMGVDPPQKARRAGETFVLGVGVGTRGCTRTVDVSVVLYGSYEYWRRVRDEDRSSFALLVPSRIRGVSAGVTDDADAVLMPLEAAPLERVDVRVRTVSPEATIVSGTVRKWTETTRPVVVRFQADWVEDRGLATCYLRLPALTGRSTLFAAQQVNGRISKDPARWGERLVWQDPSSGYFTPLEVEKELIHGNVTVDVRGGDVSAELSSPAPDRQYRGRETWSCDRAAEEPAQRGRSVPAYTSPQIETQLSSDCSVTAVIMLDRAAFWRDLILVLIGTVLSIGTTIVLEVLLHWRFAQLGPRSAA